MLMSQVLQLLLDGERLSTDQMAEVLGLSPDDIDQELDRLSTEKVLLGGAQYSTPNMQIKAS